MTVISLIVFLILLGVVFFCVEMIPMAQPYPTIVKVVSIILAVVLILQFFGFNTGFKLA